MIFFLLVYVLSVKTYRSEMSEIEAEIETDVFQRETNLFQNFQYHEESKKQINISLNVSNGEITV